MVLVSRRIAKICGLNSSLVQKDARLGLDRFASSRGNLFHCGLVKLQLFKLFAIGFFSRGRRHW